MFSVQDIKKLIEALDGSSITEFSLTDKEGGKLELKKTTSSNPSNIVPSYVPIHEFQPVDVTVPVAPYPAPGKTLVAQANAEETNSAPFTAKKEENLIDIVSPMVGTFYSSPTPDSPAFVQVGSKVNEKTVVCIVEAMKLFNEIEAECDGEIAEVLVEKGQLVEYGQVLFRVRPL